MTRGRSILTTLPALLVGALFLMPVLWMTAASLKPEKAIHRDIDSLRSFAPTPFTTAHYADAAQRGNLVPLLVNTIIVVTLIALGGLLLNVPAAYAFARLRFPGRDVLFFLLIATIIIPLEAIVIPLFVGVQFTSGLSRLFGTHTWTLAALSVPFMAKAFNIFLLRQAFLALPRTLEEAALLDGATWFGTFYRVALPNTIQALVTVVLLDFVIHWNDFLWPLVICQQEHTRTIQLGLGNFFTQPPITWGAILAYATVATIPVTLVFIIGQRWIVQSLASTGSRE
jgi:ABC-type glycerol-3-phosphate transport system permease component